MALGRDPANNDHVERGEDVDASIGLTDALMPDKIKRAYSDDFVLRHLVKYLRKLDTEGEEHKLPKDIVVKLKEFKVSVANCAIKDSKV